ncbi:cytochrome P450 [Actinomadura sp. NBRC 104425]|uniref:cytochrome P450 n=1 Tax=Actinomadura sp. NBRC 104425 TaxID=3032204 RepID=UPI0025540CB7|nr:cytochrome P450 [Actinomadura sp. NBRC 104425]
MFGSTTGSETDQSRTTRPSERTSAERRPGDRPRLQRRLFLRDAGREISPGRGRRATDITVDGITIRKGELVIPAHDAANRDPAVFRSPYRFDLTRPNAADHLSFGHGAHICLGLHLARLELQIMVTKLTGRLPDLRLAGTVPWNTSMIVRRPTAVPVIWGNDAR